MKNTISLIAIIIISFPMMSQEKLILIDKSSYYKDSKNVYFVVTNYSSNAPFFFPSSRSEIPLATIKNNGKQVDLGTFNELGIIVTAEEFEKKYRMSGSAYNPITTEFDTHSTFAIKLPGVTVESLKDFKLLNKHYVSIGNRIFLHYNELKGVDTATFQWINTSFGFFYLKDKNSVFYYNYKIIGVDVLSFEAINEAYSRDKNSVFYYGHKITGVDALSFKILTGDYSKDKNQIFFKGVALDSTDSKSFKVGDYQKGDDHVWFKRRLLDPVANLIFIKNIPKSNEILRVEFSKILNSYTTLDESKFLYALDNKPKSLDPKDEIISEWNYAPWYSITFYTDKGKYDIELFLGSLGFMTLPSGQRGAFMFDFEKNKNPSDNKKR